MSVVGPRRPHDSAPTTAPEDRIEDVEALMEQLGTAISQLHTEERVTATVVHDLATPVAIVLGACELIEDCCQPLSREVATTIQTIVESAEQMRDLVDKLRAGLELQRSEPATLPAQKTKKASSDATDVA